MNDSTAWVKASIPQAAATRGGTVNEQRVEERHLRQATVAVDRHLVVPGTDRDYRERSQLAPCPGGGRHTDHGQHPLGKPIGTLIGLEIATVGHQYPRGLGHVHGTPAADSDDRLGAGLLS